MPEPRTGARHAEGSRRRILSSWGVGFALGWLVAWTIASGKPAVDYDEAWTDGAVCGLRLYAALLADPEGMPDPSSLTAAELTQTTRLWCAARSLRDERELGGMAPPDTYFEPLDPPELLWSCSGEVCL